MPATISNFRLSYSQILFAVVITSEFENLWFYAACRFSGREAMEDKNHKALLANQKVPNKQRNLFRSMF